MVIQPILKLRTTSFNRRLAAVGHPYRVKVLVIEEKRTEQGWTVCIDAVWMLAPAVEREISRRYLRREGD